MTNHHQRENRNEEAGKKESDAVDRIGDGNGSQPPENGIDRLT